MFLEGDLEGGGERSERKYRTINEGIFCIFVFALFFMLGDGEGVLID